MVSTLKESGSEFDTRYFMNKASGRRRKNKKFQLMDQEKVITGDHELFVHATEYYKNLFGPSNRSDIRTVFDFPRILTEEENQFLTRDFSMDEIKTVVAYLGHNKAPCPDGFPGEFYQFLWDTIKFSLKRLFDDFSKGRLEVGKLNYGTITLLPKGEDADRLQRFRPVCLMNDSLKILTKGVNFRLGEVAEEIIDRTQTAFMKNRFIMEEC